MFCWDFEVDAWSRFDQDLCLNLWYDLSKLLGQLNLTLRSFVPLAMFYTWIERIAWQSLAVHIRQQDPDKSALIVRQGAGLVTHQVPCLFTSKLDNIHDVPSPSQLHAHGIIFAACILGGPKKTTERIPLRCAHFVSLWPMTNIRYFSTILLHAIRF